jgi:hypothetical protein
MPRIEANKTKRGDTQFVSVFIEGERPLNTSNTHWAFDKIVRDAERLEAKTQAADAGNGEQPTVQEAADLKALFSPEAEVNRRFATLGERVKVKAGVIYIDGDPVDNALADQILRFMEEGHPFEPLVKFYEKLLQNNDPDRPEASENSRQQLYRFLAANNFAITTEGDIVMYKGVSVQTDEDGVEQFFSIRSGDAIVNGTPHESGPVPQPLGGVVELPRSEVTFDPNITCSRGLHVGSEGYMKMYGTVIEVLVNPRDVVSVPTDYNNTKMRVCRYSPLGRWAGPRTGALILPTPAVDTPEPEPTEVVTDDDGVTYYNVDNVGGEGFTDEPEASNIVPTYETPVVPEKESTIKRLRDWLKGN